MRRVTERGAAMLAVLLFLGMIMVVTATAWAIVQADIATGIRQQQAVQVFNIAEGGIHFAIARLSVSDPNLVISYTGETRDTFDGSLFLGRAVISVRCLDSTSSMPTSTGCATNPGFRKVTSTGTLATAGPTRVLTTVVQGTIATTTTTVASNYAVCGYQGVNFDQGTKVYGKVGSNTNLSLNGPSGNRAVICDSTPGGLGGRCGTPNPVPATPFSAGAYAAGTITCSQGCSTQVEGPVAPNQPLPVCPPVTLTPPVAPGTTALTVPVGSAITVNPSTNYGAVTLDSVSGNPSPCPSSPTQRATLVIDSGTDSTATVTVTMRTLSIGKCGRVAITGVGKVVLWITEPTNQALSTQQKAVLGTTSLTPAASESQEPPISAGRFTINVVSTNTTAVRFNQGGMIAGVFIVPNGGYSMDQAQITNGAILANTIQFDQGTSFTFDPRGSAGGFTTTTTTYSSFNQLRYWKDQ